MNIQPTAYLLEAFVKGNGRAVPLNYISHVSAPQFGITWSLANPFLFRADCIDILYDIIDILVNITNYISYRIEHLLCLIQRI